MSLLDAQPLPARPARYMYNECTDLDIVRASIMEDGSTVYKCERCNAKLENAKRITGESAILVFASLHVIDVEQVLINFNSKLIDAIVIETP